MSEMIVLSSLSELQGKEWVHLEILVSVSVKFKFPQIWYKIINSGFLGETPSVISNKGEIKGEIWADWVLVSFTWV